MYSKANSEAEYMDLETLWDKANDAINIIIRPNESTETDVSLQPCIEGISDILYGDMPKGANVQTKHLESLIYIIFVGKELICRSDSRFDMWGTKGYGLQVSGRNRKLPGYPVIDLGKGLNSTVEPSITKTAKDYPQGNKFLGLLYSDDLYAPVLVPSHWLVPAIVAISGLLLLLSFWRIRQKRRRRRRVSSSGRFTSPL